jgi:hypothetical protein
MCQCGSFYEDMSVQVTLCQTETALPPTCEELLDGLSQDPILISESCASACRYFDVECREDADGVESCGSRYEQVNESGTTYPTCFCGPMGQQGTEICGSPCGGADSGAAAIRPILALASTVMAGIFILY